MFRFAVAINLAPVIVLLLIILKGEAANVKLNVTTNPSTVSTNPSTITNSEFSPTLSQRNMSATHMTTSHKYNAPQFSGMLKRLLYVTLILSGLIGFYFLVKFCRSAKRKPRKYGVVKTPGDMEMRPLESDDDEDEDVTMFTRKD